MDKSEAPFERWPGYNEQSWQERFAELDRRFESVMGKLAKYVLQDGRHG